MNKINNSYNNYRKFTTDTSTLYLNDYFFNKKQQTSEKGKTPQN